MALGRHDVDALLAAMTGRQLSEWMAYYALEPWGESRADLRAGIVASTVANVNRGKGDRAYKPDDFMPDFDHEDEPQTPEQMERVALLLNAVMGGDVVDGKHWHAEHSGDRGR